MNTTEAAQAMQWEGREAGIGADVEMESWLQDWGRSMSMSISLEGYAALVKSIFNSSKGENVGMWLAQKEDI